MGIHLSIPELYDDQILLWLQNIFLWSFTNYIFSGQPTSRANISEQNQLNWKSKKRIIATFCCVFLPGFTTAHWPSRIAMATLLFGLTTLLYGLRIYCAKRNLKKAYLAELEILSNFVFLISSATIIILGDVHLYATVLIPMNEREQAFVLAVLSSVVFLIDGGTRIVRGILDDSGASPKIEDSSTSQPNHSVAILSPLPGTSDDIKEYNRGELIGNLERLLLVILVLAGKDETLGLIIAAKGLIRSRQFENRDLTEYVIIGTLSSTLLSVIVGLILRYALTVLWRVH